MLVVCTAVAAVAASAVAVAGPGEAAPPAQQSGISAGLPTGDQEALVRLRLPDQAALERLVRSGADVAAQPSASPRASGGTPLVDVVVNGRELEALRSHGASVLQVISREGEGSANFRASQVAAANRAAVGVKHAPGAATRATTGGTAPAVSAAVDTLHFLQAYWWSSQGRSFVQVEVATTAVQDPDVEIQVTWESADGRTGTFPLQRFVDAGEYQYHVALPQGVPAEPVRLVATSSLGGTAVKAPRAWPGATPPSAPAGYQQDFISAYMTPVDVQARLRRLARQYPNLVDLIDLPNQTNGYRRTATAYVGDPADAAIVVESRAFGSSGGNGLQVKTVAADRANRPLSATFRDRVLTVTLATGADGGVISTTDQVAAFVAAKYPQRFNAFVEDGSAGKPMPVVAPVRLSDGLTASGLSRPWPVKALRIGTHRDGTRPGVLVYSQEHAREWATPLVTMEFAERLLANAASDPETAKLLDAVDVFVLPVTNPDGANYSFNDYNFQRKNMDNFCTGAARHPKNRNRFGVDVNRNHTVGSVFDGYVGGSLDCLSSGAAGPAELSEAESSNVISLAKDHSNIKYAMNVHSDGGYFMWPTGAYSMPGPDHPPAPRCRTVRRVPVGSQTHRGRHQRLPRHRHLAFEHRARRRCALQCGRQLG